MSTRTLPTPPRTVAAADLVEYLDDIRHAGQVVLREAERLEERREPGGAGELRQTADRLADLGELMVAAASENGRAV